MSLAKIVLGLTALIIMGVGLVYLIAPAAMVASNGMTITTPTELHTIRAGYGAIFVAHALLFALGALRADYERVALIAVVVFMGGFACGRILSIIVDGMPVTTYLFVLATEIASTTGAVVALRRRTA